MNNEIAIVVISLLFLTCENEDSINLAKCLIIRAFLMSSALSQILLITSQWYLFLGENSLHTFNLFVTTHCLNLGYIYTVCVALFFFCFAFFSWVMLCVCFTEADVWIWCHRLTRYLSIYLSILTFCCSLVFGDFSMRAFSLSLNLPISSKTLSITFAVSFVIDFFVWVKVLLASFSLRPWMCFSKMVCCIWWN